MKYQVVRMPVTRERFLFNGHDEQVVDTIHAERLEVVALFAKREDARQYVKANDSKKYLYQIES